MGSIKNNDGEALPASANPGAMGYGPHKLAQWMNRLLDMAETRLTDGENALSPDAIRAVVASLRDSNDPDIRSLLSEGWEMLYRAVEEVNWSDERSQLLERLIVRRFSHLLPPRGKPPVAGKTLSRRIIPAFLFMLQQMIGRERLDAYQAECHELVDSMKRETGDIFEWQQVYHSFHATTLVQDILVLMTQYLTDVPKRRHWMIDVFSRNMPAPQTQEERDWHFGDQEFHLMMDALYAELAQALSKPDRLTELRNRYGERTIVTVQEALRALIRDRQIVAENLVERS